MLAPTLTGLVREAQCAAALHDRQRRLVLASLLAQPAAPAERA